MRKNKIIVTGAAGILGQSVCQLLQLRGSSVVGIDIASHLADGAVCDMYVGSIDLTEEGHAIAAIRQIVQECGPLYGLINVAGGFVWETVESGSPSTWDRLWATNLKTCLHAVHAALPHLSSGGTIINISAAASQKAALGMAPYAASKAAVSRLTESLAEELKPRGIRVNALLPTIIDTAANRRDMPDDDPALWVHPNELAEIVSFLLSPAASAINGALIPVSGRM